MRIAERGGRMGDGNGPWGGGGVKTLLTPSVPRLSTTKYELLKNGNRSLIDYFSKVTSNSNYKNVATVVSIRACVCIYVHVYISL